MTAAPSWTIGTAPDCDIQVDSSTVSGRHCRLTQRGDSYLLEDLQSTNGTFLRDEPITGPRMVRRGEPVMLGQDTPLPWPVVPVSISVGRSPDNDVVIPYDAVSSHHACVQRDANGITLVDLDSTNGTAINDPEKKISRAPLKASDFVFLGTHRVAAADLVAALPATALHATTVPQQRRPDELSPAAVPEDAPALGWPASFSSGRSWLVGLVISLAIVAVFFAGSLLLRSGQPEAGATAETSDPQANSRSPREEPAELGQPKQTPTVTENQTPPASESANAKSVASNDQSVNAGAKSTTSRPAPRDPWDQVRDDMRAAVFLLAVEDTTSHRTWPVGSACAIREKTLLTSGNRVRELAAAKQRGWTTWAINEPSGVKVQVDAIRVHVGYRDSAGEPQQQIFFDLGLVSVPTTVSTLVPLASPAEMKSLEPGLPLGCVGVEYEVEPLYRFQSNEPDLNRATLLDVAPLGVPPAPSLLIFRADLPTKQYGAAVVNEQGKLCGVFAEFAETDNESEIKMHYAPMVDSEVIDSSDLWVEPVVPNEPGVDP